MMTKFFCDRCKQETSYSHVRSLSLYATDKASGLLRTAILCLSCVHDLEQWLDGEQDGKA